MREEKVHSPRRKLRDYRRNGGRLGTLAAERLAQPILKRRRTARPAARISKPVSRASNRTVCAHFCDSRYGRPLIKIMI